MNGVPEKLQERNKERTFNFVTLKERSVFGLLLFVVPYHSK